MKPFRCAHIYYVFLSWVCFGCLFVFFSSSLVCVLYVSRIGDSIRWTLFLHTHTHTFVYTYLSICLIFDIFEDSIQLEMKMWTQAYRRRRRRRRRGRKNKSKHFKADKRKYTQREIHTKVKMYIWQTFVTFWIFLSIFFVPPPHSRSQSSLSLFLLPFLISSHFLFLVSLLICTNVKKGQLAQICAALTQCPWSLSIRGIITPTFICKCFLISVRLHSSNQSFSQTELNDFPYQFRALLPSRALPRSLSLFLPLSALGQSILECFYHHYVCL